MPGTPLRSWAEAIPAMVSMSPAVSPSGADAGVMMPSPLNWVSAKILTLSAVSSRPMESFSHFRFFRIWRAEAASRAPSGSSVLKSPRERVSASFRRISGSLRMRVSHWAVWMTSSTRMLPSASASMSERVLASNSSPAAGQLRTVHILRSSSPRWRMSSPLQIFTRTAPPTEAKVQEYVLEAGFFIGQGVWFSGL